MQDDKKKLMVLAVLGVLLLGLGAFTMLPGEAPKPAGPQQSAWKPPAETVKAEAEKLEPPRNPAVVAALPRRDPFNVPAFAREQLPDMPKPVVIPEPTLNQRPIPRPRSMGGRLSLGSIRSEMEGRLPRMDGVMEPVRPIVGGSEPESPGVTVTQVETPAPPEPTFDYALNGVILGRRPAAVLRDKQGNQRLVTEGGMIDGDSTLIEVRQGAAIVDVRGKRRRIELNGDKDAK